jgi:hypothetical protein
VSENRYFRLCEPYSLCYIFILSLPPTTTYKDDFLRGKSFWKRVMEKSRKAWNARESVRRGSFCSPMDAIRLLEVDNWPH